MSSAATTEGAVSRRARLIGKGWIQGVALVMLFGFTVMGLLAYRTYTNSMPQPQKVVTESGETLFTTQDITEGQKLFQARGLMEYGSILGHGGYLGPDFTAEYLRMEATSVKKQLAAQGVADPAAATKEMMRTNRYDPSTGTLVWTDEQVKAYNEAVNHYTKMFGPDAHSHGLKPDLITDPVQVKQVTAFFGWTAWGSSAQRPGHDYSYTNNWPAESLVGNAPTGDLMIWSVLSLIVLIGGTGVMFAIYGRWSQKIGWHSEEAPALSFRQPEEVGLTKSQRVVAWYVFTIAALFLVQTLLDEHGILTAPDLLEDVLHLGHATQRILSDGVTELLQAPGHAVEVDDRVAEDALRDAREHFLELTKGLARKACRLGRQLGHAHAVGDEAAYTPIVLAIMVVVLARVVEAWIEVEVLTLGLLYPCLLKPLAERVGDDGYIALQHLDAREDMVIDSLQDPAAYALTVGDRVGVIDVAATEGLHVPDLIQGKELTDDMFH